MTIKDVKDKKQMLEKVMETAILQFEETCGVTITTITLDREEIIGAGSIPHIELTAEVV